MTRFLLHLFLLGIATNLDNLGVGLVYGLRRIKVPPSSNLAIALTALVFGYISALAGSALRYFLAGSLANLLGAFLLIGMGIWIMLAQEGDSSAAPENERLPSNQPSVLAILRRPEQADQDDSRVISLREALYLGVAVSLNCLANGLSAGLWRLGALPTALSMACFSYAAIWLGTWLGARYGAAWLGKKATVLAGCLLLLLGVHQLLQG